MTNEELVREIQSGKTEKMSELWEQVRRYYWELEADSKEVAQAIKALRRPEISRSLRAFW